MFIPSCNHCGRCGCVCGTLPYTMTVEFAGLVNKTHTQHCALTFASCFGSGAAGVALSPGGTDPDDRGPLAAVLLTEPGCGYAVLGRQGVESLTITGTGTGAVFTVTTEEGDDECGRPVWAIASVAVSGGTGYSNGETLVVRVDGVVITQPVLILHTERAAPTLTATVDGTGSGAVLSVTVSPNGTTPETWGVSSVTVLEPGSGYESGSSVVFDAGDGVEVVPAVATIVAGGPPGDGDIQVFEFASDYSPSTGSGAEYDYTFTPDTTPGFWLLSVTVTNGGSGYAVGDILEFVKVGGGGSENSIYEVTGVDGGGAITAISLTFAGGMTGSAGGIASVTVTNAGEYFIYSGVPESVEVSNGGEFYGESADLPAIVADVTVTAPNCGGTGEDISATVNSTPGHKDFGRITGLTIADGGEDHLAWEWTCTNHAMMNGEPIVLVADNPTKLVTLDVQSSFGSGACLRVVPVGNGTTCDPPIDVLYDGLPSPIREVEIVDPGSGYARVTESGVEVATVTVNIVQLPPSAGTGGAVSVTVDDDPDSPTFGEIVGTSLTGGSGYTILGAPRDCSYSATPCPGREVSLELRGYGRAPLVRLQDAATEIVFVADDVLDDCNSLPATASLWYGAPSGSVTITRNGTVATECEFPAFCAECVCPLDAVADLGATPVSFSSECPCFNGSLQGSGTIEDGIITSCQTESEAFVPVDVEVTCCEASCEDTGECIYQYKVCAGAYVYNEEEGQPLGSYVNIQGCVCTEDLAVVDGVLTGSVDVPLYTLSEPPVLYCTGTVTFG